VPGRFAFIVLLCYGGGFGTMPAFARDFFGSRPCRLDLWPDADGLGVCRRVRADPDRAGAPKHGLTTLKALELIAGIMLVSAILPFVIRPPKAQSAESIGVAVNQPDQARIQGDQTRSRFEANHGLAKQ